MSTVNILMMVDAEAALASGDLQSNIYLVDTNKYLGSGSEGEAELVTKLHIGDTVVCSVASIDPGSEIAIDSFGGVAVSDGYITPVPNPLSTAVWQSKFAPPGGSEGTSFQYNATLKFNGTRTLTFDPFLVPVG